MTTMNISLPEALKGFVDQQVAVGAYGSSSEYMRDLIRKEQDRQKLRALVLKGLESPLGPQVGESYFDTLRARIAPSQA